LGTHSFSVSHHSLIGGAYATYIDACEIEGTTKAVCRQTYGWSESNQSGVQTSTSTLTGSDLIFAQVPITAGAHKLAHPKTAACTAISAAAAVPAFPRQTGQVYKVLIVPGAAALVAGALL